MQEILVLYHSREGACAHLARHIGDGIATVADMLPRIRTVPPIGAASTSAIPENGPPYVELDDLESCCGLAMGSPVYFGAMAAELKHFIDQTTPQWISGNLVGKPACVFTSSSSLHGGQEMALVSMMLPLLHHGMVLIGIPYTEPALNSTLAGGTPYGASHFAGEAHEAKPINTEIQLARALGERLAKTAQLLNAEEN